MIDYLSPSEGPVFPGLEQKEVTYAKDQPQYNPLRTLVSEGPERRVISRWTLTDTQRKAIADGADIFLGLLTFGQPLQPIIMMISDGKEDTEWVEICLLDRRVISRAKQE